MCSIEAEYRHSTVMATRSDLKRAAAPIVKPMEYSLRSPSSDVFDSPGHATDDAELRQFIMNQFSTHTSHIQSLLQSLEQRIMDSLHGPVECAPNGASGSPLRLNAKMDGVPPAPQPSPLQPQAPQNLPGVLSSDATAKEARPRRMSWVSEDMRQMTEFTNSMSIERMKRLRSSSFMSAQGGCERFMSSRPCELLISFLILLNAMIIGAQADIHMRNPVEDVNRSVFFRFFEVFFTVVFLLELSFRMVAERPVHFLSIRNPNFHWNVFDFCLVASSILEEVLNAMLDSTPDVSMLRMFRIVRLVRLFRIVRVMRFFKDLRIMVAGIAQSMQSLVWALLLLFCVMYLVAVCVLQFAAEEVASRARSASSDDFSGDEYGALKRYFGSLSSTLYTLYMSVTGGMDWGEAADALFAVGWPLGCFYIAYTAFSVLCVLNIVTGVFVENCNKMTAKDDELVYMEQMEQRRVWYEEVKEMFERATSDDSGYVDAKEFSDKVKGDVRLRAWMQKIGVHVEAYSADGLFKLMDLDGDGFLDLDEFATALQQVHGQARSIDVAKVLLETKMLRQGLLTLIEKLAPECFADRNVHRLLSKSRNKIQLNGMQKSLTTESVDSDSGELL